MKQSQISGRNMILEPVMFERDAAPKEVRDVTHLYCIDEDFHKLEPVSA